MEGEDQAEGEAVARALLLGATQPSGGPGSLVFQALRQRVIHARELVFWEGAVCPSVEAGGRDFESGTPSGLGGMVLGGQGQRPGRKEESEVSFVTRAPFSTISKETVQKADGGGFSWGPASEEFLRTESGRMVFGPAGPFSGLTVRHCDSGYRTSGLGPKVSMGQPLPP